MILTSSHGRGCCCCHPTPTHESPFCGRHDHLRKIKHMVPIQHPILPCGESAQSLPHALVQRCDHGLPAAAGLLGVPMQLQRWSKASIGITVARADGWSASTAALQARPRYLKGGFHLQPGTRSRKARHRRRSVCATVARSMSSQSNKMQTCCLDRLTGNPDTRLEMIW